MKNRKGFTLIELIVVVIIMSITAASAVIGLTSYLSSGRSRARDQLEVVISLGKALSQTNTSDVYLNIYKDEDAKTNKGEIYMMKGTEKVVLQTEDICNSKFTIWGNKNSGSSAKSSDSDGITIGYLKGTGGFKTSDTKVPECEFYDYFSIDCVEDTKIYLNQGTGLIYRDDE